MAQEHVVVVVVVVGAEQQQQPAQEQQQRVVATLHRGGPGNHFEAHALPDLGHQAASVLMRVVVLAVGICCVLSQTLLFVAHVVTNLSTNNCSANG